LKQKTKQTEEPEEDFKTKFARLSAWRDQLRGVGKNRKERDTPFKGAISPKSKPRRKVAA
jgi:hypothetical protein